MDASALTAYGLPARVGEWLVLGHDRAFARPMVRAGLVSGAARRTHLSHKRDRFSLPGHLRVLLSGEGEGVIDRARAALARGEHALAVTLYDLHTLNEAFDTAYLNAVHAIARGELLLAEHYLYEAAAMARATACPWVAGFVMIDIALVETLRGDHGGAKVTLGSAIADLGRAGAPFIAFGYGLARMVGAQVQLSHRAGPSVRHELDEAAVHFEVCARNLVGEPHLTSRFLAGRCHLMAGLLMLDAMSADHDEAGERFARAAAQFKHADARGLWGLAGYLRVQRLIMCGQTSLARIALKDLPDAWVEGRRDDLLGWIGDQACALHDVLEAGETHGGSKGASPGAKVHPLHLVFDIPEDVPLPLEPYEAVAPDFAGVLDLIGQMLADAEVRPPGLADMIARAARALRRHR